MAALSLIQRYEFFDANLPMVRRAHQRMLLTTWICGVLCGALFVGALWHT